MSIIHDFPEARPDNSNDQKFIFKLDIPDDLLFKRLREGDRAMFDLLFKKAYQKICFYVYKCLGPDPDLEFIVNGTFIKIWENRAAFKSIDHLWRFMYVVTRNECVSRLRKQKRTQKALEEIALLIDPDTEQPDLELVYTDIVDVIFSSINELPAVYGNILRKTVLEGKPHSEIAEDLSITSNLVTVKKFRALTLLRSMLVQLGISF